MTKRSPASRRPPVVDQIPSLERPALLRPAGGGTPVWHGLTPTRFATEIPPSKGPIRGRARRASLDVRARAIDAKGTPQLTHDCDAPRN
jgi:hypothetical protein